MRRVLSLFLSALFLINIGSALNFAFAQATSETSPQKQININSASPAELMALPGIGEERSAAILKNRPFKTSDELVTKKVMPLELYQIVKDRITVGQP